MFRIDNTTAVGTLPVAAAPIVPGYFTDGNPSTGVAATIVDAWWCNMLQEEILTVISAAGITPNKAAHNQLYLALQALYTPAGQTGAFLPLAGGTLTGLLVVDTGFPTIQWVNNTLPIPSGGVWRIDVGLQGGFNFQMNTAPAGDFSTLISPLTMGPTLQVRINGDLLLLRVDQTTSYITRPNNPGYKNLGFAVDGNLPLDQLTINSAATTITGTVGIGGNLSVNGTGVVTGLMQCGAQLNVNFGSIHTGGNVLASSVGPGGVLSGAIGCTDTVSSMGMWTASGWLYFGSTDAQGSPIPNEALCSITEAVTGSVGFEVIQGSAWKPGGGSWEIYTSSRLVKKDIEPYDRGLEVLRALRPITYKYNGLGRTKDDGVTYHGFVAEELIDVIPEMLVKRHLKLREDDTEKTALYGINLNPLTYTLVNAVKELADRLDAIEAKSST
jgi:hypothetical protein